MEYSKDIQNRLKRLNGQVQGVLRMMNEEKNCKEVVTQLSAIRSAVDKTIATIVAENLQTCVLESSNSDDKKIIEEAVKLLINSK